MKVKCSVCGKFIKPEESRVEFTPDSDYTVEKTEWICKKCSP